MGELFVIYRAICTMCGQVREFQSERAARSHIDEHQRSHRNPSVNWTATTATQIEAG